MGEKETATALGDPAQAAKAAGPRKDEAQRWVQDDTPEGETGLEAGKASGGKKEEEQKMQPGGGGGAAAGRSVGKHSPELMIREAPAGGLDVDDDGDGPSEERGMNSIRNLKA